MPRYITLLVASALLLTLSACSSDPEEPTSPSGGSGGSTSAGKGGGGGTSSGGGGGAATDPTVPSSTTDVAVWDAFMTAKSYSSWTSDPAPRAASGVSSPHGQVRVFFNPTLISSIAAGNGASTTAPPHTVNSMAVKELYDDAGTQVGTAASLKVDAASGGGSWVYYCKGPANRCYGNSPDLTTPLFGKGDSNCSFCHGGFVLATPP